MTTDTLSIVGIASYCQPNVPGFYGLFKTNVEDFVVNEIDDNNNLVELTCICGSLDFNCQKYPNCKSYQGQRYPSCNSHQETVPLEEETVPLEEATVPLEEKTVLLQEATVPLEEKTVLLQEETVPLQTTVPLNQQDNHDDNLSRMVLDSLVQTSTIMEGNVDENVLNEVEMSEDKLAWLRQMVGEEKVHSMEQIVCGNETTTTLKAPTNVNQRTKLYEVIQKCFQDLETSSKKVVSPTGQIVHYEVLVQKHHLFNKLSDALPLEDIRKLIEFLNRGPKSPDAHLGVHLMEVKDKLLRSKCHHSIAKHCPYFITKTEKTVSGSSSIGVFFSRKMMKKRKRDQSKEYIKFVLKKTGIEHFEAMFEMSKLAHIPVGEFSYAGTKDKVGITYQHIVVRNVSSLEQLKLINTSSKKIAVGNFQTTSQPLVLGKSNGNRFTIYLRKIETNKNVVLEAIECVSKYGFINYFGPQRVGIPEQTIRSHHIGLELLQRNWKKAVHLLLAIRKDDHEQVILAKNLFLQKDLVGALKLMPWKKKMERIVLKELNRFGMDSYKEAIEAIPHNLRQMYVHSYQSLVFNKVATERVNRYGRQLILGDLYFDIAGKLAVVKEMKEDEEMENENGIQEKKASIFDVVLPLPGGSIQLPENEIGKLYHKILESDNLTLQDIQNQASIYSLKGAYRKLFIRPKDVESQFEMEMPSSSNDSNTTPFHLRLSFSLEPGCYATMCLRDMMKNEQIFALH